MNIYAHDLLHQNMAVGQNQDPLVDLSSYMLLGRQVLSHPHRVLLFNYSSKSNTATVRKV